MFATSSETWLATKLDVHEGTLENIEGRLRTHLLDHFGQMYLSRITAGDVLAWQAKTKGTRSPSTLNGALGTLRQILALAELEGLIPRNPAVLVKPLPNTARREIHPLTAAGDALARRSSPGSERRSCSMRSARVSVPVNSGRCESIASTGSDEQSGSPSPSMRQRDTG